MVCYQDVHKLIKERKMNAKIILKSLIVVGLLTTGALANDPGI